MAKDKMTPAVRNIPKDSPEFELAGKVMAMQIEAMAQATGLNSLTCAALLLDALTLGLCGVDTDGALQFLRGSIASLEDQKTGGTAGDADRTAGMAKMGLGHQAQAARAGGAMN